MALLGAAGVSAAFAGSTEARRGERGRRGGGRPWDDWEADVNAHGNSLSELGALSTTTNGTPIADFAGENLSVDDGTLNAEGTPESIHFASDYPGDTLDRKLDAILDSLPTEQPGHRIVVSAPDPEDPAAYEGTPAWRFESPITIDNNVGKLVFDMGWTIVYATRPMESFFVVGPDGKTENITLNGGMFYARGNLDQSFVDIRGAGHMHVSEMYLQSLEGRNSVPAGIRLADYHGSSELTIEGVEVTGCRDGFLAEQKADVPYGAAFDLDIYNWRAGGGENAVRIDGGVAINLDSIQTGGASVQSVSDSVVKLENSVNSTRKVFISNVRERHNSMDFHSGVTVADVTDGEGDRHDGVYIQNVDVSNAEYSTDVEYVTRYDQQNLRPAPTVRENADGSTRWFDGGVEKRDAVSAHEFRTGGDPAFVVGDEDVRIVGAGAGVILTAPDGESEYRLRVDADGDLVTEAVEEGRRSANGRRGD